MLFTIFILFLILFIINSKIFELIFSFPKLNEYNDAETILTLSAIVSIIYSAIITAKFYNL